MRPKLNYHQLYILLSYHLQCMHNYLFYKWRQVSDLPLLSAKWLEVEWHAKSMHYVILSSGIHFKLFIQSENQLPSCANKRKPTLNIRSRYTQVLGDTLYSVHPKSWQEEGSLNPNTTICFTSPWQSLDIVSPKLFLAPVCTPKLLHIEVTIPPITLKGSMCALWFFF